MTPTTVPEENNAQHRQAEAPAATNGLLYGLDDRPAAPRALFAALAHLLAIVTSIATAPLLIAQAIGLNPHDTAYVVGTALLVSGIATFIQVYRIGPIGSGLLSIQGTSFAFVGIFGYAASSLLDQGMVRSDMVGVLLGSAIIGAATTVLAGAYIERLSRWLTLDVTGVVIFLLGLSLMQTAISNFQFTLAGSTNQASVWVQAVAVISIIALCATRQHPWLRLLSIPLGLCAGLSAAAVAGDFLTPSAWPDGALLPRALPFPIGFDIALYILMLPIFLVTVTESVGDITATSMLSKQPLSGPGYWTRIRGGVIADGLNTILAASVGTFPNTTFSQNNGVIQVTGVASRVVGYLVACGLILLGVIPAFSYLFTLIPGGVLHATTLVLFTMIALAGLRILKAQPERRQVAWMLGSCTLIAFALTQLPDLTFQLGVELPDYLSLLLGFPVATGAMLAIIWQGFRNRGG